MLLVLALRASRERASERTPLSGREESVQFSPGTREEVVSTRESRNVPRRARKVSEGTTIGAF